MNTITVRPASERYGAHATMMIEVSVPLGFYVDILHSEILDELETSKCARVRDAAVEAVTAELAAVETLPELKLAIRKYRDISPNAWFRTL